MGKLRDEQKGIIFIVLILVVLLLMTIFFVFSLQTDDVQETINSDKDNLVRILFVVEDEQSEVMFSNVLIYNPSSKKGALYNLPGYTGAIYQSLGKTDRLDNVYNQLGIQSYVTEIQKLLGVKIPFYSIIKIENLVKLCDMLDGMRVFLPSPIDVTSENGERWLLPSGAVNLDGDKVYTYLKYRSEEETEDNIQDRYQNVMHALLTGLHNKNFVIFSKDNFEPFSSCFQCNLDEEDKKRLFSLISEMDTESTIKQTVTGMVRTVDNQRLLFPLNGGDFIRESVAQTTSMILSKEGQITSRVYVVEVLNGSGVQKQAKRTADRYENASYRVSRVGNAEKMYDETVIIDHIGNYSAAENVGKLIYCDNIEQNNEEWDENFSQGVDFTVILGKDFVER